MKERIDKEGWRKSDGGVERRRGRGLEGCREADRSGLVNRRASRKEL